MQGRLPINGKNGKEKDELTFSLLIQMVTRDKEEVFGSKFLPGFSLC